MADEGLEAEGFGKKDGRCIGRKHRAGKNTIHPDQVDDLDGVGLA